jgi:quercetin dioxygenase-like cupin family protein
MNLILIHTDKRGSILGWHGEELKHPEVAIFITKKDFARGGCIHKDSDEYTCIISGEVSYQIGSKTIKLKDGGSAVIPKNTPHYFVSLTDSVVLEWGAKPEEKQEKYKSFRQRVDRINGN